MQLAESVVTLQLPSAAAAAKAAAAKRQKQAAKPRAKPQAGLAPKDFMSVRGSSCGGSVLASASVQSMGKKVC